MMNVFSPEQPVDGAASIAPAKLPKDALVAQQPAVLAEIVVIILPHVLVA